MNRTDKFQAIRELADAVCDQTITPAQTETLEQLLFNNPEAQRFYYQYIENHVHLQTDIMPAMEMIRRRMLVDEVIVRPMNSASKIATVADKVDSSQQLALPAVITKSYRRYFIALLLLLAAFLALFQLLQTDEEGKLAELISGDLLIEGIGRIEHDKVFSGVYKTEQAAEIKLLSGDVLQFAEQSIFKLYNASEVELKKGSLTITAHSDKNIFVSTESFNVQSQGDSINIDLAAVNPNVTAQGNAVLMPKRWRPKHYWSFDSQSDRAVDFAGDATGVVSKGAKRIKGMVGTGAFAFDNSKDARINVGSGGGTVPASGSFSVSDGVTIEALIIPLYSGRAPQDGGLHGEIDEIFRKDQSDKDHRMLLSFQHDIGKNVLRPEGDFAESLSFGLYILGQGYHELKLPLDGKAGRPTLAELKDGKMHHVVATYDVKSGLKAIFIDGQMLASYQYPAGSKMLSGGAGLANIGNSPNAIDNDNEAYAGVIDEVAFYDFALPPLMVSQHYQHVLQGKNYFGFKPNAETLPVDIQLPITEQNVLEIDMVTGLPNELR